MTSKKQDTAGMREYKYTQEISQMVRVLELYMSYYAYGWCVAQMFVFGEVPEPNQDTVNLVEDIVRGQIIELVRCLRAVSDVSLIFALGVRLCRQRGWLPDAGNATSLRRTSYSSSDTTAGRSIASGRTSRGKTCGSMRRTVVVMLVPIWSRRVSRTARMVRDAVLRSVSSLPLPRQTR